MRLALLCALVLLSCAARRAAAKKKDWSKIDLNVLEKEWEDGDDAEELESEFDALQRRNAKLAEAEARRGRRAPGAAHPGLDGLPPGAMGGGMNGGGTKMMFIDVKDGSGKDMPQGEVDVLVSMYKDLLLSGSVDASFYVLGDGSALVTVRAHDLEQTKDFLFTREEVKKLRVDSQDFYPPAAEREL